MDTDYCKIAVVKERNEDRESWSRPIEFFLTMLGYCVGLGNILRFPYVCMQNGGGAFLIPYFLCLFVCGMPAFFLEVGVGQSTRESFLTCWDKIAPIIKGAGYSSLLVSLVILWEYHTSIMWIVYYLYASCSWTLPWTTCNATWNTERCVLSLGMDNETILLDNDWNATDLYSNDSIASLTNMTVALVPKTAAEEYWENHVLEISSGIDEVGGIRWQLFVASLVGWAMIYLCVIGGVQTIGKAMWVMSLLPYILITIFLIRGAMLPGAMIGIEYYVIPDFSKLTDVKVWMMGFLQIFYSLGPGWGGLITMASFNEPNHPVHREAIIVPLCNCFTSFYAGFAVFSCAGFLAYKTGLPIDEVLKSGPGLSFVTYPEIAGHLPAGPVWSICFFLMLLLVAANSQIVVAHTVVSGIRDTLKLGKWKTRFLTIGIIMICMISSLLFCSRAGMYYFQIIDWYLVSLAFFTICLLECIGVVWIYKFHRFANDMYHMVGIRPPTKLFVPLIGVLIPILLLAALVWTCLGLKPPTYGDYIYPDWARVFGVVLSLSMIIPIFLYVIIKLISFAGSDFKEKTLNFMRLPQKHEKEIMEIECEPLNYT